jgi:hypothetical protein
MDKGQLDNASSAVVVRISSAEIPSLISHIEAFFLSSGIGYRLDRVSSRIDTPLQKGALTFEVILVS